MPSAGVDSVKVFIWRRSGQALVSPPALSKAKRKSRSLRDDNKKSKGNGNSKDKCGGLSTALFTIKL
jgi:hypothetical protein